MNVSFPKTGKSMRIFVVYGLATAVCCSGLATSGFAYEPNHDGAKTRFDVHRHVFHFSNAFVNTPTGEKKQGWKGAMKIDLPIIGTVDFGQTEYGLCGGMCFAALDTFLYQPPAPTSLNSSLGLPPVVPNLLEPGGAAPPDKDRPAEGSGLRSYIFNRQRSSLELDGAYAVKTVAEWVVLPRESEPGITGLQILADREFRRKIAPSLDAGRPIPLCLVRAGISLTTLFSGSVFTGNHQVLAIGYRLHQIPGSNAEWDIDVYDPNFPDQVWTLHTASGRQARYIDVTGHVLTDDEQTLPNNHDTKFRGLFATPYTGTTPPWLLTSTGAAGAGAAGVGNAAERNPDGTGVPTPHVPTDGLAAPDPAAAGASPANLEARLARIEALLSQMQTRLAQVEVRLAALEGRGGGAVAAGATGAPAGTGATALPALAAGQPGYETVRFAGSIHDDVTMKLTVNGQLVGSYDQSDTVVLDRFLKPGAVNKISFAFDAPGKDFTHVELEGQFPNDNKKWTRIFSFKPSKKDRLEASFDVPYAGPRPAE